MACTLLCVTKLSWRDATHVSIHPTEGAQEGDTIEVKLGEPMVLLGLLTGV